MEGVYEYEEKVIVLVSLVGAVALIDSWVMATAVTHCICRNGRNQLLYPLFAHDH